jgi:hypothetical protein
MKANAISNKRDYLDSRFQNQLSMKQTKNGFIAMWMEVLRPKRSQ